MGIGDAEVLPYLFDHLPPRMETRLRIANPNTIDAFFTQLRIIWLESGGASANRVIEETIIPIPQKNIALEKFNDIARRLGYSGDLNDPMAIHNFVEFDLTNKLGVQSNNIKKEHLDILIILDYLGKYILQENLKLLINAEIVEKLVIERIIVLKAKEPRKLIMQVLIKKMKSLK
jgi:hypothetical protein